MIPLLWSLRRESARVIRLNLQMNNPEVCVWFKRACDAGHQELRVVPNSKGKENHTSLHLVLRLPVLHEPKLEDLLEFSQK